MRSWITVALPLCLVLALIAACGDGGSTATPTPVAEVGPQPTAIPTRVPDIGPEPTATPTRTPPESPPTSLTPDTPVASRVTGTITYRERIALSPDAVVEVKLSDVSLMDVAAVTIEEQVIRNPGQVPIEFEIEYDPDEIDERFTYAIQVRITERRKTAVHQRHGVRCHHTQQPRPCGYGTGQGGRGFRASPHLRRSRNRRWQRLLLP